MGTFQTLPLKKEILHAVSLAGFSESLEVQETIVPLAIQGNNIVFTSQTGSGKTLAYLLGFLGKINNKHHVQMIVLVPTRELCIQVGKEIKRICDHLAINVGMLYGGRDIPGDYKTLSKKNQIIVATPGRLLMHVNEKKVVLGQVKYIVYDESDQMFDHGFFDNCVYIKKRVSKDVQIILSSATMTDQVKTFIDEEIVHYTLLQIGDLIPPNIVQKKIYCEMVEKDALLLRLFSTKKYKRAMIFCNTKEKTQTISSFLKTNGYQAKSLNSNLEQEQRLNHLNLFKDGKINILVTTDVAARGLHIEQVDIVINYDVPTRDEFYIHRMGRTGRSNQKGYSLTLICPEDIDRFFNIEFEYNLHVSEIDKELKPKNTSTLTP